MDDREPLHIYVPGSPEDPRRSEESPSGIVIHRGPPLDPADMTIVDGIPCTSPARTLIDLAEVCSPNELYGYFVAAWERGILDLEDLVAARARVEWRPSLAMLDSVVESFRQELDL